VEGLNVLSFLPIVLLDHHLHFLHLLVEHIEQLGIFFVLDFSFPHLLPQLFQFFLKMVILDFQIQISDAWLDLFLGH
jgi:hypothetical protein